MNYLKHLLIITLVFTGIHASAQLTAKEMRKQKKELKAQEIVQLIENRHFTFKASSLTTQSGFYKDLTGDYEMVLKSDSVSTWLPYWGRVYMGRIDDEGGIKFNESMEKFEMIDRGKKGYQIKFTVNHDADNYHFTLHVSKSGFADLVVSATRKSMISYHGTIEPEKSK